MKKILILSLVALVCTVFAAFTTQNQKELTHVNVVHHSGNQVLILDTVFDPATGYTAEQFLLDHGLNPENAEIIITDNMAGPVIHKLDQNIWFMNNADPTKHRLKKELLSKGDENGKVMIMHGGPGTSDMKVRKVKTVDADGNEKTQTFVNGEEVEGMGDNVWIDAEGSSFQAKGDRVVMVKGDDAGGAKTIVRKYKTSEPKADPNTEEINALAAEVRVKNGFDADDKENHPVSVKIAQEVMNENGVNEYVQTIKCELLEGDIPDNLSGDGMEVQVEKTIENGVEQIQMWINGEEVDPADYPDILIGEGEGNVIIEIEWENDGDDEPGESPEGTLDVQVQKLIVDGEEQVQIWINGEEVNPADYPELLDGEGNGQNVEIIIIDEETGPGMCQMDGDFQYTLVLVSTLGQDDSKPTEKTSSPVQITDLKFSPNPTSGQFNVSFNLPQKAITQVVIYDIQGKVVFEDNLGKYSGVYSRDIDISSHGTGTYILNIIQGSERLAEKIIVQ